jgi:uncharacterized repeat protein (TIGR03803 family)
MATLTDLDGVLYGTTVAGGGGSCKWQFAITAGCGTIFSVKRSGEERVIYRFTGHRDGEFPNAQMTQVGQVLYGTTSSGGSRCFAQYRCGTVFKITSAGDETVLFRFRGMAPYRAVGDGSNPNAGLLYFNGMLYGTTERGGLLNHGTVFAITTDGKETVLHRFGGAPTDGDSPDSTLTHVSGTLYGTTSSGGAHNQGTVFAITMSGKVTILHSFNETIDGSDPSAGLVYMDGTLYGTTQQGSANQVGTVFAITPSGTFTTLHCFSLDWDGANPTASLIAVGGRLYGTASGGDPGEGYGSVFSITPAGEFTVLHGFGPASPSQRTSAACKPERSGA